LQQEEQKWQQEARQDVRLGLSQRVSRQGREKLLPSVDSYHCSFFKMAQDLSLLYLPDHYPAKCNQEEGQQQPA
jgi:hypothetical protein